MTPQKLYGSKSGSKKIRYPGIRMQRDGVTVNMYVHKLVLTAFRGERPDGMQASHLNGQGTDARLCNLVWESPVDNNARKEEHGTVLRGEENSNARLTSSDVREMRRRAKRGESQASLGKEFGVNAVTAHCAIRRKTWRHIK